MSWGARRVLRGALLLWVLGWLLAQLIYGSIHPSGEDPLLAPMFFAMVAPLVLGVLVVIVWWAVSEIRAGLRE